MKAGFDTSFLQHVPDSLYRRVLELSESQIRNSRNLVQIAAKDKEIRDNVMVNFLIEWHRKFSLSFACILLYLIGAPLGAIIRKGGLGLPLIIAVVFFVTYIIVSKTGEMLSKSQTLAPYWGMWLSTLMLLPFAFVFIREARNDSRLFSKEWYFRTIGKFAGRIKARFKTKKA
jgi:lipopolysaccharide export system permease protein